ncbi:MAG: hypothetical protein ACRCSB_05480 [Bacteroidales bacterium]
MILGIIVVWIILTLIYFRQEISFLLGSPKKNDESEKIFPISESVIGEVRDNKTFFGQEYQNTNILDSSKDENTDSVGGRGIEYSEDINPDDIEIKYEDESFESADEEQEKEAIEIEKSITELQEVVDIITSDSASEEEEYKAGKTLKELDGTDFLEQMLRSNSNERIEYLLQELDKVTDDI